MQFGHFVNKRPVVRNLFVELNDFLLIKTTTIIINDAENAYNVQYLIIITCN